VSSIDSRTQGNRGLARAGLVLTFASLLVFGTSCQRLRGAGDLRINDMTAGGDIIGQTMDADGELEVWLSIEFLNMPEGIDPRDVEVVFEGNSLGDRSPKSFDWEYIASKARQKRSDGRWGRVAIKGLSPSVDPPLNQEMDIFFKLDLIPYVEVRGDIYVKANVYWGGTKQDHKRRSISHMYER